MKNNNLIPCIYKGDGVFVVNKMINDEHSIYPNFDKLNKSKLDTEWGIDEGNINEISAYDGFIMSPENDPELYRRSINTKNGLSLLNIYELPIHPKGNFQIDEYGKGNWPTILDLILHIAPMKKPSPNPKLTYTEWMLDYLAISWNVPSLLLPTLVLVSKEKHTGKTTFMELLKLMFQNNAKKITVSDFTSNTYVSWGFPNIILMDEKEIPGNIMKMILEESLKESGNIVSNDLLNLQINNSSKFIISLDEIENLNLINEGSLAIIETELFMREPNNSNFIERMKKELPHFLDFLTNYYELNIIKKSNNYVDNEVVDKTNNSKSDTYVFIRELFRHLYFLDLEFPGDCEFKFSISGLTNKLELDNANQSDIKNALAKLGIHKSKQRERFLCMFSLEDMNTFPYSVSKETFKSIYDQYVSPKSLTAQIECQA